MLRKVRLENTRTVLSDLDDAIKGSMSTDVDQLMNFAVSFKAALLEVQLKITKMISVIDEDQFPDDKRLQGQILELEGVSVPSITVDLNQLRDKSKEELATLQNTVSLCFERMTKKLKLSPGEEDMHSVFTTSVPAISGSQILVEPLREPLPASLASVPTQSVHSSSTVVPARPSTAPPPQKVEKIEEKEAQRPMTAADIRKTVAKSVKNYREHLLEEVVKNDFVPQLDAWSNEVNDENDHDNQEPTDEDDVTPWDSVSNVGSPDGPPVHTTTTVPINPVRITMSTLKLNCAKVVIPRREFTEKQEVINVLCEWMDGQFHPYKFWLRANEPEYVDLAKQIESHKSQIRLVSADMIQKKLYCLAKYQCAWYRGYVTDVSQNHVVVLFIDYGNMERISFNEVAHLPPELADLKWQAFRVALFSIKPSTQPGTVDPNHCGAWFPGVVDMMKSYFQDDKAILDCRIEAVPKKLPTIVIIRVRKGKETVILHKKLIESRLVHPIAISEQVALLSNANIPATSTSASIGDRFHSDSIAQKKKELADAPLVKQKTTSSQEKLEPIASDAEVVQPPVIRKEEKTVSTSPKDAPVSPSQSSLVAMAFNAVVVQNSIPIDFSPPLPVDREFNVKISEFNTPDDFSVQLAEAPFLQSKLFIDQELAKRCCEKQGATARVGRYVVYHSPKRDIYARGKIVAISNNGQSLDVVDVDTGIVDSDIAFPGDVGSLPNELKECNRISIRVALDVGGSVSRQLRSDFELRVSDRILLARISPKADIEKVASYRTSVEPLPLLMDLVEGNRKTSFADLIFASDRSWKFDDDFLVDDGDDEDEVTFPTNPDMYLLGFEPKDDEMVCKHFRRTGHCPRGEYCTFKHVPLAPYQTTIEKEEFGLVGSMEPEPHSRIYLRLPCDWEGVIPNVLQLYPTANVIPLWFQLPLGADDWKGREEDLWREIELRGDVTEFEESYVEMEIDLIDFYNSMEINNRNKPQLIPTEQMHVAVRVSPRMLGSDDENDQRLLWVRALVVESLCDDRHARVRLLDYGNEVVVSSEHIRALDERFAARLPSLSMFFYVDRHSVEGFFKNFSTSDLIAADVIEIDNAAVVPVIKLLAISSAEDDKSVVVKEY